MALGFARHLICALFVGICCWPVRYWRKGRREKARQRYETRRSTPDLPPELLPSPRPRALTIPLLDTQSCVTANQSRSLLLARLPLEIRQMIWKESIGTRAYHLQILRGNRQRIGIFNGVPCELPNPVACHHFRTRKRCRADYSVDPILNHNPALLSVLLSCRQM